MLRGGGMYDSPDRLRSLPTEALVVAGLHEALAAEICGKPMADWAWDLAWELRNRVTDEQWAIISGETEDST